MKILQITHDYPYTSVYKQLFSKLDKYITNIVIVTYPEKLAQIPYDESVISLYCLKNGHLALWRNRKPRYKAVLNTIDPNKIDVSHAHFLLEDGDLAYDLKKTYNIPYVVTIRNSCMLNISNKYKPHLFLHGLNIMLNADRIIFLSPSYKKRVIDLLKNKSLRNTIEQKSIIIPNGIDDFWLNNIYAFREIVKGKIIFLTVSSIDENKNHIAVVKALEILETKGYQVEYRIVGRINDRNVYNRISEIPFLKYYEPLPKEKLIEQYRSADIFILASKTETFGLVYAEAMTQGLPVIYSKNEGFDAQFSEGEVGFHASSNSPEEICEAIEKVLTDYTNISKRALLNALKFDWLKIANELNIIYEDIKSSIIVNNQ